jgi:uncharacterized protein (TIGR02246 family)
MKLLTRIMSALVVFWSIAPIFSSIAPLRAAQQTDDAAIRAVFAQFSTIWNRPGMPGFEELFAEDADFVVVTGRRLTGRAEIVTYHRELLNSLYKGSQSLPMKIESLRFLTRDIAIAHVTSGASYVQDGKEHTRTGRATAMLVKQKERWLITAFHNTLTSGPGALVTKPPA